MADKFRWSAPKSLSLLILIAVCVIGKCEAKVQITSLGVPRVIQEGDVESVILDCEYTLKDPYGLVVKWYHLGLNDKGVPKRIYQWIEGQTPTAFGAFKNSVNLSHIASVKTGLQHHALYLLKPARNMSGTYQCVVETYNDGTAQQQAKMLVYVPQSTLQLSQERLEDNDEKENGVVRVICAAEDVFPEPEMRIRIGDRILPPSSIIDTNITQSSVDLLYDIRVTADVTNRDVTTGDTGDTQGDTIGDSGDVTTVTCELAIPEADYVVRQEAILFTVNSANTLVPFSCLPALMTLYFVSQFLLL